MNPVILLREQGLVKALDDGEEDTSSGAKQVTTASRFSAHQAKDNHRESVPFYTPQLLSFFSLIESLSAYVPHRY